MSSPIEYYVYDADNLHNIYRTYFSYEGPSSLSYKGAHKKMSDRIKNLVDNILILSNPNNTNIKDVYRLIKKVRLASSYEQEDMYNFLDDVHYSLTDYIMNVNTQKSLYELGLGYFDRVKDTFEKNEVPKDLFNIAPVFDYISTATSPVLSVYASGLILYVLAVPNEVLNKKELESVLKIKEYKENGQDKIELGCYLKSVLDITLHHAYENAGSNKDKKRYIDYSNAAIKYIYENGIIDDSDYLYCIYNLTSLKTNSYEIKSNYVQMYINIITNTLYPEDYLVILDAKLGLNIKFDNIRNDVAMKARYLIGISGLNAFYLKTVLIYNFHNVVLDERNSKPGHNIEIKENIALKESFKNHVNIVPLMFMVNKISLYRENQAYMYM